MSFRYTDLTHPVRKGTIIRYSDGPTAMIRIKTIVPYGNGEYGYYGEHVLGGTHYTSSGYALKASQQDIEVFWPKYRKQWNLSP